MKREPLLKLNEKRKGIESAGDSTLYKDDTKNERFEYLVEEDEIQQYIEWEKTAGGQEKNLKKKKQCKNHH